MYAPAAVLTHLESQTRGMAQGERELASQAHFWKRWGDWFDRRDVSTPDGKLRIVYVTQDLGVGGGHRVVFEHLNGLIDRGHHAELWTLGTETQPDWFDLRAPVRTFEEYPDLVQELADVPAIKVATWWETADRVWEASVRRGIGAYFVQDIETSYYARDVDTHGRVLTTYRPDLAYLTTSQWVTEQLLQHVPSATAISPGVDRTRFPELGLARDEDTILGLGRSNPLKNFPLTRDAYLALPEPRPQLTLFGIEPELAEGLGPRVSYEKLPSDERVNELYNTCTVLLQTSRHEGFCLPILEAMSAGAAVVCTDADGNRDFCEDGVNCLMPAATPRAVRDALQRVLGDPELRARLAEGGRRTAEAYAWPRKLDQLEQFFVTLAAERGDQRFSATSGADRLKT
jgi:glycosyltransferase involved in cell wall biosynthesis